MTTQQPIKNQTAKGIALLLVTMSVITAVTASITLSYQERDIPNFTVTGSSSAGINDITLTTTGLAEAGIK